MVSSASVLVTYKCVDGWHVFQSSALPGLYVASVDLRRAFMDVAPSIETLVELDTGVRPRVAPDMPLEAFVSAARAELHAAEDRRYNLFAEAA